MTLDRLLFAALAACSIAPAACLARATPVHFGVIGDYGVDNANENAVGVAIKTFSPEFITTVGDNNYFLPGNTTTWDRTQAKFYREFIELQPTSAYFGQGAAVNAFYPLLGNHDIDAGIPSYTDYFTLPGNERYYTFTKGPVQFFMLSSDTREPDGALIGSTQQAWFLNQLAQSTAQWKLVCFHHPAQTSASNHTFAQWMRDWHFESLGVTAVLSGHNHFLERIEFGGIPWFVIGSGGNTLYNITSVDPNSAFRNNTSFGFMIVDASDSQISFKFINTAGTILDTRTITVPPPACAGDTNGDGDTNGADLSVLLGQFGTSVTPGTGADLNDDGIVNAADLSVLLADFNCVN